MQSRQIPDFSEHLLTNSQNTVISKTKNKKTRDTQVIVSSGPDKPSKHTNFQKRNVIMTSELTLQNNTNAVLSEQLVDNLGNEGLYTGGLHQRTQQPHGQGCMEYERVVYEGQWVEGDWSGFGKLQCRASGSTYEGSFLDNMRHGLGVMMYADGRIYDGNYRFDKKGKGRMFYKDGSTHWGYWSSDDLPQGRGKLTYSDGSVYDGEFERGCIQGHGRMTLPDGRWYLGEWTDGKKNGLGLEVSADGILSHEGVFCNGVAVMCSSFPQRRKSIGSCLFYRTRSAGKSKALVGPLPRHLSMQNICYNFRFQ
jgi:hypothetical protein